MIKGIKMKINKWIIFMLLLLSIVMIGAASAASDDGTSVSSDLNADDSIIEMEEKAIISDADNDDNELSAEKSEQKNRLSDDSGSKNTIVYAGYSTPLTNTAIEYKNMNTTAVSSFDGRVGEYFNVTLKDANGKKLANKTVLIGFNGKEYAKTTDDNGKASLQINLGYRGDYTFAICFLGDDDYKGAFVVALIKVAEQTPKLTTSNKIYKASAKTKTLTATFKTSRGNAIVGKSIKFTVNGKTYSAKTDGKGVATVKVSLSTKKTYAFTVKWPGDSTFLTATAKGKLTIN